MKEQPHFFNTEEYLTRVEKTDFEPEGSLSESLERLRVPLHKSSYEEEGTVEGSFEGNFLSCSYSSIDEVLAQKLQEYLSLFLERGFAPDSPVLDTKNWRRVDRFLFENNNGQQTDLLRVAPADIEVFFCPSAEIQHGAVNTADGVVYILGDILTLESVTTFMHEIGHLWDAAQLEEKGVDRLVTNSWNGRSENAELVRKERAASAFALQKMKPFLKGLTKKDVGNHLKAYALQSYYAKVRETMANTRDIERYYSSEIDYWQDTYQKEEEDYLWETWWEWRTTPAYQEWKSGDEFKDIDEWEEFGSWRAWLEKTGYDPHKDLPGDEAPAFSDPDDGE